MKTNIMLLLLICLLLVGCGQSSKETPELPDERVGTDGVSIEFASESPPKEIFEGTPFPVILKLANTGATSIGGPAGPDRFRGILTLAVERDYLTRVVAEETSRVTKLERKDLGGYVDYNTYTTAVYFSMEGKTSSNTKGDEEIASFIFTAGELDPQRERQTSTIIATACYLYNTSYSSSVCVDADPAGISPVEKSCEIEKITLNNGQGGPVAITLIESQMLPSLDGTKIRPQFFIHVENQGEGEVVYSRRYDDLCKTKKETADGDVGLKSGVEFNVILVEAELSNQPLKCSPEYIPAVRTDPTERGPDVGYVRLRDKKDFIRCVLEDGVDKSDGTYLAPLSINLHYGYTTSVSTSYELKKVDIR